ncbi:cysteine desulfurase NifS [Clostridium sediminicola]|uniref:cysteine desulfurase family protein n=1 Tax=Clostridium sediminicola TaxID=3114879 RepID=UPI0031F262ED
MKVYADHAATTPVDKQVFDSMKPYLDEKFYNASSLYIDAKEVSNGIEQARNNVASLINCQDDEIIFTSGGTEADNLAIKGAAWALKEKGRHLITTEIEHHAVLSSFEWLETQGFEVTYLPVDSKFKISLDDFRKAIRKDTIMASVMYANNEVGTIQQVKEMSYFAKREGIVFHTDAVQAIGTEKIDVKELNADLITISSHKIYGPKGAGVLYVRKGTPLTPLLHGGQQENHIRGGTEAVANIIGFGKAVELLLDEQENRKKHLQFLRSILIDQLGQIEDWILNGDTNNSVPGILNISIKGVDSQSILYMLNQKGIMISMGSACNSKTVEPSHVINAGKVPEEYMKGTIRISLGKENTVEEIKYLSDNLYKIVNNLRRINF